MFYCEMRKMCLGRYALLKICGQNHSVGIYSIRDQKCRDDLGHIFPERTRRDSRSTQPALKEYMSAVVAVAARNCSRLLTSHLRAASLHRHWSEQMARACMRWGIPSEEFSAKMHMNNVQNEIRVPTRFILDIPSRACCFIRVARHIFIVCTRVGRIFLLILHSFINLLI